MVVDRDRAQAVPLDGAYLSCAVYAVAPLTGCRCLSL
jgi:hypothetical protein